MAYTIEEEQELNQLKEWWKRQWQKHYCRFYSWCRRDVGLALLAVLSSHNQIMQASAEYDALVYTANKDAAAQQAKSG